MKKILLFVCNLILPVVVFGQTVSVSIAPQKYIVDSITGGNIKVNVVIPAGADPHTYSPKAEDMGMLAKSKLYITIGFPVEETIVPKIIANYKDIVIVDSIKGLDYVDQEDGDHGNHDEHHHNDHHHHHNDHICDDDHDHGHHHHHNDPHFWTDPASMLVIADNTYNALVETFPEYKTEYTKNYKKLVEEITMVDKRFKDLFKNNQGSVFLVFHPSYKYFAETYGLIQLEIEKDGKTPKAKEIQEIIKAASHHPIIAYIVQPTDNPTAVKIVADEVKIQPVQVDILDENWKRMMDNTYKAFGGK